MALRLVSKLKRPLAERKVKHYVGLPPELDEGKDSRQELGSPAVLLIEETESGIFLERFGADGSFAGDTWHRSVEEAKEQATFEYGELLSDWREVPSDVTNVATFAYEA